MKEIKLRFTKKAIDNIKQVLGLKHICGNIDFVSNILAMIIQMIDKGVIEAEINEKVLKALGDDE